MAITFWSDPHLGLVRSSHTTVASRAKLQKAVYDAIPDTQPGEVSICLGDLFDTATNEEAVIAQGLALADRVDIILGGNHDSTNRDSKLSSLELIEAALVEGYRLQIVNDPTTDKYSLIWHEGEALLCFVSHKRSQELFEETLRSLKAEDLGDAPDPKILCLHCNYDSGFADNDSTLNLTREMAGRLLKVFDFILLGHEHQPRSDFDGRLQILGNIHPTSFADISDKFIWRFENGKLEPLQVWSTDAYWTATWETLLASAMEDWSGVQFIDVTGTAPAAEMPRIAKAIAKLWVDAPDALMIRNSVKSEELVLAATTQVEKALDVPTKISQELKGTPLEALWNEYLQRV